MNEERRPHRGRIGLWIASAVLGLATTIGVAIGLAAWAPIERAGGTVALDGDHLQPWLLHLERFGADRIIWFEKGRIYGKQGVGPAGGSSSAVACWSFATATRRDPRILKGQVDIPAELHQEMDPAPRIAWGVAHDRRGWPMRAFDCVIIGPTSTRAPSVYLVRHGFAQGAAVLQPQSLAPIRVVPYRPVWVGLVVNTVFYGLVWWAIISAGVWLVGGGRAQARLRRGHCPACGYDLLGNVAEGCPECGWNRP